ncbi:histone-lysine N-methyltransferase SETMAR [Elysia marginata]|uniref:Histone-lysine N-methyltransferase SETMAR n=1 Tax=Elysia marginata TaxID=1093978 RepID=A0AAV4G1K9_9GAST|nr:histone-lysine N-methyltransferase SETMAR [Elysia marginata]
MDFKRATSFDDWIWVKDKAFSVQENLETSKYFVEWNALDNVFAVTNRIGSRGSQDVEDRSVTGAFSIPALHSIQATLHGINPAVPKLPASIPRQPKGLSAVFVGLQIPKNMKKACKDLESYFSVCATQVGSQVLNEVMFEAAAHTLDVYYEKMSDVYRNDLEQEDHKLQRVKISQRLLLRCQQDNGDEDTTHIGVRFGGDFRARNNLFDYLITDDETWDHLNTPETKRDSMTWKHPSSPVTKNFKVQRSAAEVMATVF